MRNQSNRAAAQTASIGNQDMMTFMPGPVPASNGDAATATTAGEVTATSGASLSSSQQQPQQRGKPPAAAATAVAATAGAMTAMPPPAPAAASTAATLDAVMGNLAGATVPDPLRPSFYERGESMDDDAFNASLDALLKDACGDGVDDSIMMGPPPPTTTAPAMPTTAATAAGRKRKLGSLDATAPELGGAGAAHLNFSARGIVQLPPMFVSQPAPAATAATNSFGQQPISVAAGAGALPGTMNLFGTDFFSATPAPVTLGGAAVPGATAALGQPQHQPQPHAQPQPQPQPQNSLPFQVASLTMPQPGHAAAAPTSLQQQLDLSSSAASLMTQMLHPPPQPQATAASQAQQATNDLFQAFQLSSTNPWDTAASLGLTVAQPQAPAPIIGGAAASSLAPHTHSVPQSVPPPASTAMVVPSVPLSATSMSPAPQKPSGASLTTSASSGRLSHPTSSAKRWRGGSVATKSPAGGTPACRPPVSEDESERQKRRSERNLREQERSHRITERIAELRNVLSLAGVSFKPDRYSTLVSVVDYIKHLQGKSVKLDEEHRRLLDTISGADRMANSGNNVVGASTGILVPGNVVGSSGVEGSVGLTTTVHQTHQLMENTSNSSSSDTHSNTDDEFLVFVQGIDYKSIFASCAVALAIASVDGRFVDCNEEFLKITDYSRTELLGEPDGSRSRKNVLPHPRDTGGLPPVAPGGQGKVVTVSTSTSTNSSALTTAAAVAAATAPDVPTSSGDSKPAANHRSGGPPPEIHMRKQHHLSLFNLLGGEDMETVYAAMSRMLRAPETSSSSSGMSAPSFITGTSSSVGKQTSTDDGGGTSSGSSDCCVKSDLTRSTEENSSSGNEVMNEGEMMGEGGLEGVMGEGGGGDHWTGKVKHMRRKDQMVRLNISLVRTADGRPKFFNCSLSEAE